MCVSTAAASTLSTPKTSSCAVRPRSSSTSQYETEFVELPRRWQRQSDDSGWAEMRDALAKEPELIIVFGSELRGEAIASSCAGDRNTPPRNSFVSATIPTPGAPPTWDSIPTSSPATHPWLRSHIHRRLWRHPNRPRSRHRRDVCRRRQANSALSISSAQTPSPITIRSSRLAEHVRRCA